jgi:hypothetical protein
MLREAAPQAERLNVRQLRTRVSARRRARRRRVVGSIVAGLVVLALLVVAVSFGDGTTIHTRTRRTPPANNTMSGSLTSVPGTERSRGVAASRDELLVSGTGEQGAAQVLRVDPSTGQVGDSVPIGAVPAVIAHHGHQVWVAGGGDGGEPRAKVSVLDDTTLRVLAEYTAPENFGAFALAFVGDDAWATSPATGEVVRFRLASGRIEAARFAVGTGPQEIAAVDGELWIRDARDRTLARFDPVKGEVIERVAWSGVLAGTGPGGTVWGSVANTDGRWSLLELGRGTAAGAFPVVTRRISGLDPVHAVTPADDGMCAVGDARLYCWTAADLLAQRAPSAQTDRPTPMTTYPVSSSLAWMASSLWVPDARSVLRWSIPGFVTTPTTTTTAIPLQTQRRLAHLREMDGIADPALPAGWLRCVNSVARFSIGAPAEWYTANVALYGPEPGPAGVCFLFDPQPFQLDSEVTATLMLQRRTGETFDTARSRIGPPCCDVVEQRDAVVDGRRAIFEVHTSLEGVFAGATWACYLIDRYGEAFSVCTIGVNGSPVFADRVNALHQSVATLRFD